MKNWGKSKKPKKKLNINFYYNFNQRGLEGKKNPHSSKSQIIFLYGLKIKIRDFKNRTHDIPWKTFFYPPPLMTLNRIHFVEIPDFGNFRN